MRGPWPEGLRICRPASSHWKCCAGMSKFVFANGAAPSRGCQQAPAGKRFGWFCFILSEVQAASGAARKAFGVYPAEESSPQLLAMRQAGRKQLLSCRYLRLLASPATARSHSESQLRRGRDRQDRPCRGHNPGHDCPSVAPRLEYRGSSSHLRSSKD